VFGAIIITPAQDTITITAVGGNFSGGVLRIVATYDESTPPTS